MANDPATIEALVRKVVMRTLGAAPGHSPGSGRPLLDETALRDTPTGATLDVPPDTIITPLARQVAQERHITLREGAPRPRRPRAANRARGAWPSARTTAATR